jgi:hypothetical protein
MSSAHALRADLMAEHMSRLPRHWRICTVDATPATLSLRMLIACDEKMRGDDAHDFVCPQELDERARATLSPMP